METGGRSGRPGTSGKPDAIPATRSHPREVVMPFLSFPRLFQLRLRPLQATSTRGGLCSSGVRRAGLGLPGMVLFSGLLLGLPVTPHTMAQMQALNRELGKLCNNPPRQALSVCRIHARLVDTF